MVIIQNRNKVSKLYVDKKLQKKKTAGFFYDTVKGAGSCKCLFLVTDNWQQVGLITKI